MTDHREALSELERLASIISDDEIARVHGHANFGQQSPRDVVNDGVRKYAVGYEGGYTQLTILLEHGLIKTPRPGSYAADLTKKGKKYARQLYQIDKQATIAAARERDALRAALEELQDVFAHDGEDSMSRFERLSEMFRKDTGYLAPGKDPGLAACQPDGEELRAIYDAWFVAKVTRARAALSPRSETPPDKKEG